jgi:hypothetical protein
VYVHVVGWHYVSELRPPVALLFIPQVMYEYGETWWNDINRKTKGLCDSLSHYHRYNKDCSAARGRRSTAWAMARPWGLVMFGYIVLDPVRLCRFCYGEWWLCEDCLCVGTFQVAPVQAASICSSKILIHNMSKSCCTSIPSVAVHVRALVCKIANDEHEERVRDVIKIFSRNFPGMYYSPRHVYILYHNTILHTFRMRINFWV